MTLALAIVLALSGLVHFVCGVVVGYRMAKGKPPVPDLAGAVRVLTGKKEPEPEPDPEKNPRKWADRLPKIKA
jgi:hypothetical protein